MENNNDMNLEQNEEITAPEAKPEETKKARFPLWVIPIAITVVIGIVMAIVLPGMFADKTTEPVYGDYTISIVDGLNNPMSNVVVKFTYPDGTTKSRITEADGTASIKNVELGDYKVNIEAGFSTAVITEREFTLTKDVTDLRLILRDGEKTMEIFGSIPDGAFAYSIGAAEYNIPVDANGRFYFIFNALTPGVYRVSLTNDAMTVGFYGIPFYVQESHCGDGAYDGKTFELIIQDTATPYVIGIDSQVIGTANLKIERISDAPLDPNYVSWIEVRATQATFEKCDFGDKTLIDVDIADPEFQAILGDDGIYRTSEGKVIYIRITTTSPYGKINEELQFVPVLGGSLALLAGCVDVNVGINVGGHAYDEQGNFLNKYRYNDMIKTYMDLADNKYGVVPLTAELAECIKLHGESNGWWNANSYGYIFDGIDVVPDNAWLFLCMIEQ